MKQFLHKRPKHPSLLLVVILPWEQRTSHHEHHKPTRNVLGSRMIPAYRPCARHMPSHQIHAALPPNDSQLPTAVAEAHIGMVPSLSRPKYPVAREPKDIGAPALGGPKPLSFLSGEAKQDEPVRKQSARPPTRPKYRRKKANSQRPKAYQGYPRIICANAMPQFLGEANPDTATISPYSRSVRTPRWPKIPRGVGDATPDSLRILSQQTIRSIILLSRLSNDRNIIEVYIYI